MLWGGLAVAIPIILHFWHQKKGKVLEWAATQWLIEKNLQQSRSIRLDNILLLLLRCLLILLLCFFLSKPLVNWLGAQTSTQKIHLVQANSLIVNNFKFELEEALKKGEKLYWIQPTPNPINDINSIPSTKDFNPLILQSCFNKLSQTVDKAQLELYIINTHTLAEVPTIYVPAPFSLHTVVDSVKQISKPYLAFANTKLFVNAANQLSSQPELDKNGKYIQNTTLNQTIDALVLNQNKAEKQSITASLKALAEVYNLTINMDTEPVGDKKYNWVFCDKTLPQQSKAFTESTLYIVSNTNQVSASQLSYQQNVIRVPYSFNPQTSEHIFNGELPEWLGETLVKYYQLNPSQAALSYQQLHSLFTYAEHHKAPEESTFSKTLLLAFIVIFGIERYIAIRKNA